MGQRELVDGRYMLPSMRKTCYALLFVYCSALFLPPLFSICFDNCTKEDGELDALGERRDILEGSGLDEDKMNQLSKKARARAGEEVEGDS